MSFLDHDFPAHLLWIVPLFLLILWYASARRKKLLSLLFSKPEQAGPFLTVSSSRRVLRNLFLFFAILCTVFAAARPSWGHKILPNAGRGHDILVVFDVSRSMLADDVKPSRLEHAKWLVRELVKQNPADRFGLIAFAGASMLQCPLTIDKTSFLQMVDDLDTDTIAYGGTNLQDALQTAVRAFEGAEGNHKAVLLITDGDELTGHASQVVDQLAAAHIPIIAAGIGDPANPALIRVPDEKGNLKILTDAEGNTVKSPLNEAQLTQLATKTGGMYVRSVAADAGIPEIQAKINSLDRREGSDGLPMKRPIERPASLIIAALVFLAAFLLLPEKKADSKQARKLSALMPFLLAGLLSLPQNISAQTLAEPAQPPQPAQTEAPEKAKEMTAEKLFNLGLKLQKENGDPAQAVQYYERAISAGKNPAVRTAAYQNLGVIGHSDAQKDFVAAKETLQKQDLDGAEKKLDESLKKLSAAEELYRESLHDAVQASVRGPVRNQQQLQKDRKDIEELKKKIEELKKQQQDAQKQTQQARDQQKKENQQKQDQKQDQQQNAQQQTQQAKESAEKLENQAKELNQKELQKAAQEAKEELQKAAQEQQKKENQKAQEHLDKAARALDDQQKKEQQKKENQQKEQKSPEPQDNNKQDQGQQEQPEEAPQKQDGTPQQAQSAPQPQDDRKIDPKQAEALLDVMAQEEKELRDLLKEQQKRSAPSGKVLKDW